MTRSAGIALYVLAMVALIVAVDLLLFRDRPWERLAANVGIVVVFLGTYARFFRR